MAAKRLQGFLCSLVNSAGIPPPLDQEGEGGERGKGAELLYMFMLSTIAKGRDGSMRLFTLVFCFA